MKEPDEGYIERGLRQAEYANLLATIDWRYVNAVIDVWLSRMCEALYEEFGIREPSEETVLKRYVKVKSQRVTQRKGKL